MTDNRDPLALVEKLRPVTIIDDRWPAAAREATLQRLLAAVPTGSAARPGLSGRRRLVVVAAVSAGLMASSAGIAAATGLLPESFTGPLAFWTNDTNGAVDVQTARRVAQGPGPDGQVLSVWSATGRDGSVCVAPMFEPPGALDRPAPADFSLAGGQCAPADLRVESFGDSSGSADDQGVHTMWLAAGAAARAELRLPDGTVRPAVRADGMFFVWYLANDTVNPPTLVGYDATGAVVAQRPMPNLLTRTGR